MNILIDLLFGGGADFRGITCASAADAYSTGRTDLFSPTEDGCRSMRELVLAARAEKVKCVLEAIQAVPR